MSRKIPVYKRPLILGPEVTDAHWDRLMRGEYASGVGKLLRQLQVLRDRIQSDLAAYEENHGQKAFDVLLLDVETYYTVAHDLLKLVELLLPPEVQGPFKREEAYRNIASVRNHLVRHAYDKPGGNPSGNYALSPVNGLRLKGGSVIASFKDPGFIPNDTGLRELARKYDFSAVTSKYILKVGP